MITATLISAKGREQNVVTADDMEDLIRRIANDLLPFAVPGDRIEIGDEQ